MKHLVTGGSGFLGNRIVLELLKSGQEVRVLDIWRDPALSNDVEFFETDIRDQDGLRKAMKDVDVVHHSVALVPLTKSGKAFWEVNVDGSRNAAEIAAQCNVGNFVHMSSSAVYGVPPDGPVTDKTPTAPVEIYGRAKLAGELAVKDVAAKTGMPLIVIRPRTILSEERLGIFQILFDWIREGRNIYVIGDGNGLFQFIHASDLMSFYFQAIEQGKPGTYNVGANRFGTLRETLEGLVQFAGTGSKVKSLPASLTVGTLRALDFLHISPLAPWHYLTYHKPFYFDVQPLLDLGWKPRYSNREMFEEAYSWFVESYDSVQAQQAGAVHRRPVRQAILRLIKWLS